MLARHPLTLFIIKSHHDYDGGVFSNGLRNSAQFVVDMLLAEGLRAKLVAAIDGNSVDALVAANQPARVVLEALWVTPDKMAELQRLWPKVRWTVRVHSETPFLANEGIAVEWVAAYQRQGVEAAFNSFDTTEDFSVLGPTVYLPNYYPQRKPRVLQPGDGVCDVGCFGAIRPLKNQLTQAMGALTYARRLGVPLRFHVNGTRTEQNGANNLRNLRALLGVRSVDRTCLGRARGLPGAVEYYGHLSAGFAFRVVLHNGQRRGQYGCPSGRVRSY